MGMADIGFGPPMIDIGQLDKAAKFMEKWMRLITMLVMNYNLSNLALCTGNGKECSRRTGNTLAIDKDKAVGTMEGILNTEGAERTRKCDTWPK
jgi:hypothetical protein